jgi:alkaline phosphatase D
MSAAAAGYASGPVTSTSASPATAIRVGTSTDPAVVEAPFAHGVASFDPTADSVVLWTRAPGVGRLTWWIAPAEDAEPVASGEVAVSAAADHCVSVAVDGLEPATSYVYGFAAGPTRSPTGRTRTLPAAGTEPLRMAVVSCGDFSRGHYTAYRAVADAEVDLVLHVGDYIYETRGKGSVREALPDHEVLTLDDYRVRYAQARGDTDLMALHQRHPMITIWDDHDIADNAWRNGAKHHDPNEHGPWEDRLQAAVTAHHEWLPTRLRDPEEPLAVYRSFAIGDLAELVVLDTRIIGRDQQPDDEPSLPFDDPRRSMLGDAQRAWAHERVRDASRPWCLLVTQVVLNRMALPVEKGAQLGELAPSGYGVIGGEAMCTDEWDGYPAERDALVRVIAERGPGVVVLSGDVHSAWAFEGPCRDGDPVAVEFVAPCVTATPMARQLPRGWRKLLDKLAERLPEARWFELEHHGFLVVELDEDEARAHWYTVDTEDPDARPEFAAAWRHRRDHPGRLDPLDPADPLAPLSAPPGDDRPRIGLPPRPDAVLTQVVRRRRRRRRTRWAAAVGAAGLALAGARAWLRLGDDGRG